MMAFSQNRINLKNRIMFRKLKHVRSHTDMNYNQVFDIKP